MRGLRRVASAVAGAALLATTFTGCDWPEGTRYVDQVFTQADASLGVVYRTTTNSAGQQVQLRMDIYEPRGDTATERPVIMWMFGGGWVFGDRGQMGAYAQDAARRGYVGVTIDYRIRPGGGPLLDLAGDAYDDAVAAVEWLEANAATYGIDPDAIVAGGYSAGAVNAMNLAFWPGERPGPAQSGVAGAVSLAGLSLGAPDADDPPILMHHGTADTTVLLEHGRTTCNNALAADVHCTFFEYAGADHLLPVFQAGLIAERTADWVFETVLWPLGYRDEQVGG
jgi:acetyl esterase/lipase